MSASSADKEGTCEDIIYNLLVHRWNALKYWKMLPRCQIWTRPGGETFWPFRVTGVWVRRTFVILMLRVAHQIFWWSKKSCQWNENLHLTPRVDKTHDCGFFLICQKVPSATLFSSRSVLARADGHISLSPIKNNLLFSLYCLGKIRFLSACASFPLPTM